MQIKVNQIAKTALDDIIKKFGTAVIATKMHCVESLTYDVTFDYTVCLLSNTDDSVFFI